MPECPNHGPSPETPGRRTLLPDNHNRAVCWHTCAFVTPAAACLIRLPGRSAEPSSGNRTGRSIKEPTDVHSSFTAAGRAAARRRPAALCRPAGRRQGAPLSGCAAKQAAIEAKLETARSFANEGQVAGLEKALSEVKEHCTEAGLLRENKQKVIDSEREVSEREKDLRKAMGKGDPEKIEKRKAKLAEARAELEEAKKGLEQAQAQ